jgi:zeta-carotene desaturase
MTVGGLPRSVDVAIIGGGLSGLAAAVQLASNGAGVALLEQSSKLGGRCYSYIDEKTGDVVDNGQHILLGAYHNTIKYLNIVGTRGFLREQPALSLPFHHPIKGFAEFKISSLPQPFQLAGGILKFRILSLRDRQKLFNVGLALRRWSKRLEKNLSSLTVAEWLIELNQSEASRRCFWYPIAVSVMNELPERASALLFARSLKSAFLGTPSDSAVLIPTRGQTELYVHGAEKLLFKNNAKILTGAKVESIETSRSKTITIKFQDGERLEAQQVISAIPYFALEKIIPSTYRDEEPFSNLGIFESSPIVSIHLWFDREFMPQKYIGLIGKHLQWIFNRRKIMSEEGKSTSYISAVISGAYDVVDLAKEKLVAIALQDMRDVYPESRAAKLLHSIVIKEKRATFSPTNNIEPFRPSAETPIQNFFLAGDWTNTGLPATIEGAVMSGFNAAKLASG